MGIEKLRKDLVLLQRTYEQKSRKFIRSAFTPPPIKSDALKRISDAMDRVEDDLKKIEANCSVCDLRPAGPYCVDCRWYT